MTKTEKRIKMGEYLVELKKGNESPGDTILRALEAAVIIQRQWLGRGYLDKAAAEIERLREALICARNQDGFLEFPRYARELIDHAIDGEAKAQFSRHSQGSLGDA